MELVKDNQYFDVEKQPLFQTTREEDIYVASVVDQLFPENGPERTKALIAIDRLYYEAKLKCQQQILAMLLKRKAE